MSSWWCHPTILSSVAPYSSCLQSFPISGSFPMSQFSASGSQSTGVSASASILPMNIQDWFPLGWTGLASLQSKGLSRDSSPTPQFKSISSLVLSFLYSLTVTSIHDYWKWFLLPFPKWKQPCDFLLGIFTLSNDFVQFSKFWKYCSVQNSSCFKYFCAISILSDGKLAQFLNISFQKLHFQNTFYRSHSLILTQYIILLPFASFVQHVIENFHLQFQYVTVCVCVPSHYSHVWLFVTPRTVAWQASLSMEFSRQKYCSR